MSTNDPNDSKTIIENGLRPYHFIKNDDGWNILDRMEHYDVPGVALAVVKNGAIDWEGYYGDCDKVSASPITSHTLFQAASISKPVTALAALRLAQGGQVDLEANINQFLSSWQVEDNQFTTEDHVSLAGLLSHTAGISVHGFLGYSTDEQVPTLAQILNWDDVANSWVIRPILKPGVQFRYSGGGYCIVQQMIEDVANVPFGDAVSELVLHPLGMSSSTFLQPLPDSLLRLAATGYLPDGSMVEGRRHTYPELAAAGLWTKSLDLARFGLALQSGFQGITVEGLPTEIFQKMLIPHFDNAGLGIFLDDRDGEVYFQHGGWNEGFSSQLTFHRDRDYGVIVMINANKPALIEEIIRSVAAADNWHAYLPPAFTQLPITELEFDEVCGRYLYDLDQVVEIYPDSARIYLRYLNEEPQELIKVGESLYLRRDRQHYVQFLVAENGIRHLEFKENLTDTAIFIHPLMVEKETVPFEHIIGREYERARNAYRAIERKKPNSRDLNAQRIYARAEKLQNAGNAEEALELLRVNTELRPGSYVAFHRLADAYLAVGDEELALRNYKKSIKFYPQNKEAQEMIDKLENPKVEI